MQNFLTYRIAATLQLVVFFFIALFAFPPRDFQPSAAQLARTDEDEWPEYFFLPVILLILIVLLNDGTMIAIGYDHVIAPTRPAKVRSLRNTLFLCCCVLCSRGFPGAHARSGRCAWVAGMVARALSSVCMRIICPINSPFLRHAAKLVNFLFWQAVLHLEVRSLTWHSSN